MVNIHLLITFIGFISLPILAGSMIPWIRARAQGRRGPYFFQILYNLQRLFSKVPIDNPSSGVFAKISPWLAVFAGFLTWSLVAWGWASFLLIPFFLALQRIAILGFSMETGTSFGGLGASREMLLTLTSEPVFFLIILVAESNLSLAINWVGIALGILFMSASTVAILAEIAKPPFDDPRTHLELTMVHEAMLLEASGKTLGLFEIASLLKISSLSLFLWKMSLGHSQIFSQWNVSQSLQVTVELFGALGFIAFLGFWEAISIRRKWNWVPELMGLTFLFVLVLGTIVKLG